MTNHNHTINAICPWCGYEHLDTWDFFDRNTEETVEGAECDRCGRPFTITRNVSVTYSTEREGS